MRWKMGGTSCRSLEAVARSAAIQTICFAKLQGLMHGALLTSALLCGRRAFAEPWVAAGSIALAEQVAWRVLTS
jgi:hypothetical protein